MPLMSRLFAVAALLWLTAAAPALLAQPQRPGSGGPAPAAPAATPEEGIPVPNFVVQKSCATCHRRDEQNQLTRISYRRTTPEGWQQTVRRMVALNGVQLDPAEAREIVKYLSNHLGLAPEEARQRPSRSSGGSRTTPTRRAATCRPPARRATPWAA